jgi:mono/diheme cytochrome c family protein
MHKRALFISAGIAALLALGAATALPAVGQDASSSQVAAPSSSASASSPATAMSDDDLLALGKHVWSDAACSNCHGQTAAGGHSPDFPPGPNLRTSGLDPQTMLQIVECGIPDSRMPAWLNGAYTTTACYGNPLGPVPAGTIVTGTYNEDQLKALVDYVQTNFMKQPMPNWTAQ